MTTSELHLRCLEAIRDDIVSLGLSGLASSNVVMKKLPTDRKLPGLPAVVVSYPPNEGELLPGGFNQREDVGLPVQITTLARPAEGNANYDIDAGTEEAAGWRRLLLLRYHNQRLAGVDEIYQCKATPRAIIDLGTFQDRNLNAGALLVHCIARLPRTGFAVVPSGLTAVGGTGSVLVSWPAVSGANSYDVRRSPDNATWTMVASAQAGTTYTETAEPPATTGVWYFQVRVYSPQTSAWSASVSAGPYVMWEGFYFNSDTDLYGKYGNRLDYHPNHLDPYGNPWWIGGPNQGNSASALNPNWLVTADGIAQGYGGANRSSWVSKEAFQTTYSFKTRFTIPNPFKTGAVLARWGEDNNSGLVFYPGNNNTIILFSVTAGTFTDISSQLVGGVAVPLTTGVNKTFSVTVVNTPTSVSATFTEDANPTNTATATFNGTTFNTNTRYGLLAGGEVQGTVNFAYVKMYSALGFPVIPAPPATYTLQVLNDAFTDADGTLPPAHAIGPTNTSGNSYRTYSSSPPDPSVSQTIQGNKYRVAGSRDHGNYATLDGVAPPNGMRVKVTGTFDPTYGSSFGIGPQAKNSGAFATIEPNAVFELVTFPLNTFFAGLSLPLGQFLAASGPPVYPLSSQTNGGGPENTNCFAVGFFPLALGSSWVLDFYVAPPLAGSTCWQWWAFATPAAGGASTRLAYGKFFPNTIPTQLGAWTGVHAVKGGDAPVGQTVALLLDDFQAWVDPQTGGWLDYFTDTNGTALTAHTPGPTNTGALAWTHPSGTNITGTIQSGKARFTGSAGATVSLWQLAVNLTSTLTVGGIFSTPTLGIAGGPSFGLDAGGANGWCLNWDPAGGHVYLQQLTAGALTTRATYNKGNAFLANTEYVIEARVNGTAFTLYVDGVLVLSYTMAAGLTNGAVGLMAGTGAGTTMDVDNFYCHA